MPLEHTPVELPSVDRGMVFVSSSIPDPGRWDGEFGALEITDAIVALARAFLTAGFRIVTAAHPTIAPLLLYVAAEFPHQAVRGRVVVYQSELFQSVLPEATRRFEESGIADLQWTAAVEGERPELDQRDQSLLRMRQELLASTQPVAACFVGGMEGITEEFVLFREFSPTRPTYPVGRPGGAARALLDEADIAPNLKRVLRDEDSYPSLWRAVIKDLESRL